LNEHKASALDITLSLNEHDGTCSLAARRCGWTRRNN